jgi:Type I phosphodiesterase / nucleotide pyrophosphatase
VISKLHAVLALVLGAGLAAGGPVDAPAASRRLVVIKVDGLAADAIEHWIARTDPRTGKSELPWIQYVFVDHGAWVKNFYVRDISLSAPSWSMLDSGHDPVIHGNAEYDRYTGHVYDYLNFFPFYVGYARSHRVDMPSVEVLEQAGIPLIIDHYHPQQVYQGVQLFQRGVRWKTLQHTLTNRFTSRSIRELFDEWQTGFEMSAGLDAQIERELTSGLENPRLLYLDDFDGDFDHTMHLSNDPAVELMVLKRIDALIGRVWTAIQQSPLASDTVLVLVSDHGMNTTPGIFSQGYNLITFFGSAAGGGHHVLTNRYPMDVYKIKGLDPFVSQVVTPSPSSFYLRDQADNYPTALLDLDGNERAAVYLRNSDLNAIQILLEQLSRGGLSPAARRSIASGVIRIVDAHRDAWTRTVAEMREELAALDRQIARVSATLAPAGAKWTAAQRAARLDQQDRRKRRWIDLWREDERGYSGYIAAIERLLKADEEHLAAEHLHIDTFIPHRTMGDPNTIYDLQNYIVGPGAEGMVLTPGRTVDLEQSFRRVDYFPLLTGLRVRNTVQAGVGDRPIDFVAVRVPQKLLEDVLPPEDRPDQDAVWIYRSEADQALILARGKRPGELLLRYLPVRGLTQDAQGRLHLEIQDWRAGLPLGLFEDPRLDAGADRVAWLNGWHTDTEWLAATHRTAYSDAVIALHEHFQRATLGADSPLWRDAGADTDVLRRFEARKIALMRSDLLLLACNHWNFNVRNFNPGGNHGSFFRISTHSTLMFAGADIPAGLIIERPYDTLNFAPTLLTLARRASKAELDALPGRPIAELTQ